MTTGETIFLTLVTIVGYGTLFGPPIVVLLSKLRERKQSGK
ncbi:hypothetical protein [Rhizobium sp. R86522]|jgi:hypothetical protein